MKQIKTVELRFGARTIVRRVELGCLASDDYFVETARDEVEAERDDLGRFRSGRVTGEVVL